jgi:hypothetical protein
MTRTQTAAKHTIPYQTVRWQAHPAKTIHHSPFTIHLKISTGELHDPLH